ncbi:TOTE conflict system archaeo-eukaryotic primase domain-containing protein [Lentibacillus jeotgali]|uniref:TOTE conflict system archaeo-eukaryotic primase domain-containing protein n=1 Tax=Lentibacillus jeotgali TaxID=558169 RepID=UPI0002628F92|nr:DEAD/DEAH box helicase [Lentibacillus jeotgali]
MNDLEQKLQIALKEITRLKDENQKLKDLLAKHQIPVFNNQVKHGQRITRTEILQKRIAIFRSLFKGRTDVYAVHWRSNGESNYAPSRKYEPNKKYKERELLPLTDNVIENHLRGNRTIGIYPLLKDETCWFLAVDFDKKDWQKDALTFMGVCKDVGAPASMEISKSGNGCHIWIFFSDKMSAKTARKLGSLLMNRTLEKRYETGVDSFDRFFPNQDTMPKGGFGNLIALPLQQLPRKKGYSVFVNEKFEPYADQWAYLASVKKISKDTVESILRKYNHSNSYTVKSKQTPYYVKIPSEITIIRKNGIHIPKNKLPSNILHELIKLAVINNPEFFKAQSKRLSTHRIPRKIDCSYETEDSVVIPRGCLADIKAILVRNEINFYIDDQTIKGSSINIHFHGSLLPKQNEAIHAMKVNSCGVLSAATGFGKTVVAAALIAERNINTLIIVHTKQLLTQWKESLQAFFNLDGNQVGQIGGGKKKSTGKVDIAMVQTLSRSEDVREKVKGYGQVIVDECHHISAVSFEKVLREVEASYVHGLTATPTRKDGLYKIVAMQCGEIRYKVTAKSQSKLHPFDHVLIPRFTSFKNNGDNIQKVYANLAISEQRNKMIFNDVLKELENNAYPIILTERIEHVHELEKAFKGFAKNIIVLTGKLSKQEEKDRLKLMKSLSDNEERLIIATGKYIGEGFDNARLDTLFLAMPIAWKGTLQQYVGRLHRVHTNKNVVKVYGYVDYQVPELKTMYEKRMQGYKSMGYSVQGSDEENSSGQQMKLF